jgi:hypothetical protein
MMRASVRVSGVTLRPGVPWQWGYGVAVRPGCANAVSLSGASCRRCSLRARAGSRDRLSGEPDWGMAGGRVGFPVPILSVAGRPSRHVVPKTVGELFEVQSESAVGTRVTCPRVGFRVVQRPTLSHRKFQGHRAVQARPGGQTFHTVFKIIDIIRKLESFAHTEYNIDKYKIKSFYCNVSKKVKIF